MNHPTDTSFTDSALAMATRGRVFAMALLFVLVQYASVLHAADHPFHADDPSCKIFHAVEKSKSAATDPGHCLPDLRATDTIDVVVLDQPVSSTVRRYLSRAPPVHSFI